VRRTDLKKRPTDINNQEKSVFDNRRNVFLVVYVGKPTEFKSPPMIQQRTAIEIFAETPTKEVEVEAADLSQLIIRGRRFVSARVVGVALFIKFE